MGTLQAVAFATATRVFKLRAFNENLPNAAFHRLPPSRPVLVLDPRPGYEPVSHAVKNTACDSF